MCNHCPFVRHIEQGLAQLASDYAPRSLATVGISANDVTTHPEDDLAHMAEQVQRAGFDFPYLFDESQAVARAYGAVCTPDFFLYDAQRRLAYRGELDGARPSNAIAVSGSSMRAAVDAVLEGKPVPTPHKPSVGCSIKWRADRA